MDGPQLEDGYTRIANEFLEFLTTINLSSYQMRMLLTIIRFTWGYGKKSDAISISTFYYKTGIRPRHICRTRGELIRINAITYKGNSKIGTYSINKHYNTWKVSPIKGTSSNIPYIGNRAITYIGNVLSPIKVNTKERKKEDKEIISSQIENLLVSLKPFNEEVITFLSGITQMNKTKKITDSRKRTALLELFNSRERCNNDDLFRLGIQAANKYRAFNVGYINAVIKNQKTKVIEK